MADYSAWLNVPLAVAAVVSPIAYGIFRLVKFVRNKIDAKIAAEAAAAEARRKEFEEMYSKRNRRTK